MEDERDEINKGNVKQGRKCKLWNIGKKVKYCEVNFFFIC